MLSGSSDSYVVPNRRLLTQLNSSVVAVHGLGADPAWAWVRKAGVEGTDQYKKVNWLADKDLLPAKMPHARIMTSFRVRLRDSMVEKARKRHFRKADTIAFDSQFSASSAHQDSESDEPAARRKYNIPERAEVVRWICQPAAGLTDREALLAGSEALKLWRPCVLNRKLSVVVDRSITSNKKNRKCL